MGRAGRGRSWALDSALRVHAPFAVRRVARLREQHPDASPADAATELARSYVAAVTTSNGPAGRTGRRHGIEAFASFATTSGDTAFTLQAGVLFVLSRACVHGIDPADTPRVRPLARRVLAGHRRGVLALGRPRLHGLGMRTGATGSAALADAVVHAADRTFGRPPLVWPVLAASPPVHLRVERRIRGPR